MIRISTRIISKDAHILRKRFVSGWMPLQSTFPDRLDTVIHYEFFPTAKRIDNQNLLCLEAVEDLFSANGFEKVALEIILQKIDDSLQAYYQRIKMRSYSTFEFISDEKFQTGLLAMEKAADNEKEPSPVTEAIDLLVFKKC